MTPIYVVDELIILTDRGHFGHHGYDKDTPQHKEIQGRPS
jgi:hypothetical protein